MPRTQGDCLDSIREKLDELTDGEWTDAGLRTWINKAVRDIARQTEALNTDATIDLNANTSTVTGPANAIRVHHVAFRPDDDTASTYPMEYRDFNAMDPIWFTQQSMSGSSPQFWTTRGYPGPAGFTIQIYPVPSRDGSLLVNYYKYPTDLATDGTAANSNLDIPEGWDDAVEHYVEYTALRKDRDPRWQEAKALYDEVVTDLKELSVRLTDQGGVIIPDSSWGGLPGWLVNG